MLVRQTLLLELGLSLSSRPVVNGETSNVLVCTLSYKWTGTYGAITAITALVFSMTFMQDNSIYPVDFIKNKVFNITEDCIDDELEV